MIDQKLRFPVAGPADRIEWTTDTTEVIAAIIAITRREWLAQGRDLPAAGEAAADRPRPAHPLVRFAFDSNRSSAWRARADRQEWIQSV